MKKKNTIESMNNRLDQAEERIYEHKDKPFEIIKSEENKEKRKEYQFLSLLFNILLELLARAIR